MTKNYPDLTSKNNLSTNEKDDFLTNLDDHDLDAHTFIINDLSLDDTSFEKDTKPSQATKQKGQTNRVKHRKASKISPTTKSDNKRTNYDANSAKSLPEITEIDLEELIQIELDSDLPQPKFKNDVDEKSSPSFTVSWFSIFYVIFTGFFLFVAFHYYKSFEQSLKTYEASQPEHYLDSFLVQFENPEISGKYVHFPEVQYSTFDSRTQLATEYLQYLSAASLTYERDANFTPENPIFRLYANGIYKGNLYLSSTKKALLLGHFQTYNYNLDYLEAYVEINPETYQITVPSSYTVMINNSELSDAYCIGDGEEIPLLSAYANDIDEIPQLVTYEVKDLIFAPEIRIFSSSGNEISYSSSGKHISIPADFEQMDFPSTLLLSTNILSVLENYSLFLSDDLSGKDRGFSTIEDYLLKDSVFYEETKSLIKSDFSSIPEKHSLPEYVFSSREISHYTVYSSQLFSCVVSLEKNILLEDHTHKTFTETYQCFYTLDSSNETEDYEKKWLLLDIIPF